MSAVVAGLAAACSIWAVVPGPADRLGRLSRTGAGAGAGAGAGVPTSSGTPSRRIALGFALPVYLVAMRLGVGLRLVLMVGAVLLVSWFVRRLARLSRTRHERRARQRRVIEVCDGLSAELRGGMPIAHAVRRCCGDDPELAQVVTAGDLGGDVAGALRSCALLPGAEGLRAVAAAWDVAGSSGAALADVLDRMAAGLRDDEEARVEVQAALGPPRATARMLAVLPLFGLALGSSIDAHPVGFLVGTTWGLACLTAGAALALSGVWWVERLAAGAEV